MLRLTSARSALVVVKNNRAVSLVPWRQSLPLRPIMKQSSPISVVAPVQRRTLASPPPPIPIVFDEDEIKRGVMGDSDVGDSAAASARSMGINEGEIEEEKQTIMDFDRREELESAPSIVYVASGRLHHGQPIDEDDISVAGQAAAEAGAGMESMASSSTTRFQYKAQAVTEADMNQEAESAATGPTLVTQHATKITIKPSMTHHGMQGQKGSANFVNSKEDQPIDEDDISEAGQAAATTVANALGTPSSSSSVFQKAKAVTIADLNQEAESAATGPTLVTRRVN